jgi:hypothetical protein
MQHSRNEESIEKRVKELQLHLLATTAEDDDDGGGESSPMIASSDKEGEPSADHHLNTTNESSFLDLSEDDLERFDQRASSSMMDQSNDNDHDDVDASIDEIFGNDHHSNKGGKQASKKRGLKKGGVGRKGMISKQRKLESTSAPIHSFDSDDDDNDVFNDKDDGAGAFFNSSETSTFQQTKRALLDSDDEE